MTTQVEEYLNTRQQQTAYPLRLYGLVDGLLYAEGVAGVPLSRSSCCIALFDGTADEALANAGPWLLDCSADRDSHMPALQRMGDSALGCIWIISSYAPEDLAAALRTRLDVRMTSSEPKRSCQVFTSNRGCVLGWKNLGVQPISDFMTSCR